MIDAIFVIGKPGSGKSIMVWYLTALLLERGFAVSYLSDRLGLEEGILKDTARARRRPDGSKVGPHGKLIADGPPGHRKVHVLDGTILNAVHRSHVESVLKSRRTGTVLLVEYAIGPEIRFGSGKEPLRQEAAYLVELLKGHRLLKRVFILEVDSPLPIRAFREMKRPDAMAPETFRAYFPDGGEITPPAAKQLGKLYYKFTNLEEDHDGYYSEVRYIFENKILPKMKVSGKG
ncbi:hypothetical protein A2Z33_01585 [Candidatus Gottesmanbacteria bacterium RBG_16_52_11]|uniref:Uncharacterized protein n=1 Tax=Candidatus Gottesmanbacteria bacterium RBG_16_52_11 TaxID=1798374 RepID=A0A1F5YNY2_9BACT|nr:MAG: hypothetical protein A2Z33_01585 [Candidatus Gottesmanbacteria bacterium RBG_16_52_11]